MSRSRPLLFTVLALGILAVAGCDDESATQPNPATTPTPTAPAFAVAANTWSTGANMPSDRWFAATATFPDRVGGASLYVIGGKTPTGAPLGKVQVYNPATNTWTTKASFPLVILPNNGVQVIDSLVYVPGGVRRGYSSPALQVYNPKTNTWAFKASMPLIPPDGVTGLGDGVSGAINGKLYVLGTCANSGVECGNAFLRYDPATDRWTFLPLPQMVEVFPNRAAGVLNKRFYITNGSTLEVYDPTTNTWAQRAPMPVGRVGFTFAAVNNRLYVIGGYAGGTATGRVDVYDPVTNAWTRKAPIPRVEAGLSAGRVVVNGQARLEVVGGARPGNNLQYVP